MFYFQKKTWPELQEYIDKNALIILPVGELEEHSLYLPVDTDARIAEYLSAQIAEEIHEEIPVLVMPTVWSGYTPKAIGKWPGAMRLAPQVFADMIHGICASLADMGFKKLFMLDCHGQHAPMLNMATKLIADEYGYYYASATPFALSAAEFATFRKSPRGGCSHAGEWETSLILHISPELVKTENFTSVDAIRHHSEFVSGDALMGGQKVVWSSFGIQSPKNGALGDPTLATAETGKAIAQAVRAAGGRFLREYYFHEQIVID
ncbi:MAG: creatininase family protein [Planctomycetes bacterium]|nr:creatininase family protein [Planctomycetota bacterium]